jgi:hypothetical protein
MRLKIGEKIGSVANLVILRFILRLKDPKIGIIRVPGRELFFFPTKDVV